ncbi:uncharacterized protein [Miscanthus floridulus]|uniref:uncharacterized protein n=1 Tax=Miscanthus floridulus TaxID=154761 RepID=UPI00345AF73D
MSTTTPVFRDVAQSRARSPPPPAPLPPPVALARALAHAAPPRLLTCPKPRGHPEAAPHRAPADGLLPAAALPPTPCRCPRLAARATASDPPPPYIIVLALALPWPPPPASAAAAVPPAPVEPDSLRGASGIPRPPSATAVVGHATAVIGRATCSGRPCHH